MFECLFSKVILDSVTTLPRNRKTPLEMHSLQCVNKCTMTSYEIWGKNLQKKNKDDRECL